MQGHPAEVGLPVRVGEGAVARERGRGGRALGEAVAVQDAQGEDLAEVGLGGPVKLLGRGQDQRDDEVREGQRGQVRQHRQVHHRRGAEGLAHRQPPEPHHGKQEQLHGVEDVAVAHPLPGRGRFKYANI